MNKIECPYCDHEYDLDCIESDDWEEECPNCEEVFDIHLEWEPSIITIKIEYRTCFDCGKEFKFDGVRGPRPNKYKDLSVEEYGNVCKDCFTRETHNDFIERLSGK